MPEQNFNQIPETIISNEIKNTLKEKGLEILINDKKELKFSFSINLIDFENFKNSTELSTNKLSNNLAVYIFDNIISLEKNGFTLEKFLEGKTANVAISYESKIFEFNLENIENESLYDTFTENLSLSINSSLSKKNIYTGTSKSEFESKLFSVADMLRGKVNPDEYRNFTLGFIFYKYLSEKMYAYANNLLKQDKIDYLSLDITKGEDSFDFQAISAIKKESIAKLGYFLYPEELFSSLVKKSNSEDNFILDKLTYTLKNIENTTAGTDSEEDFDELFSDLDLSSKKLGDTPTKKNELISKIMNKLNEIDFDIENNERDLLGDSYEYLIGQFAADSGKKAGEFYTPQSVAKILAKIVTVNNHNIKKIYDPTCGSGSLLLRVAKELDKKPFFFGQELNRTTFNLARMNMLMHNVHYSKFNIKQGDTLLEPKHKEEKFDAIVSNPPFSAVWDVNPSFLNDERFSSYGRLAPASKADFAFIQHCIHQLEDNGTMAVVLPHGVLFRGGAEGEIRKVLIENKNYLDAVIGLPANIFYGTTIPTCILVLKKCREDNKNILFIDASSGFEKSKNQNLLRETDIEKIVNTYKDRIIEDKYSYLASLEEIKENDYNLNIPRYVDTFEEENVIDLDRVSDDLKALENDMKATNETISSYCRELNISTPF
jgi:type I restriction enzyme M protein